MPTPENEQKIRYLSRYRRLNARIDRLLEEKSRWWELALKITPALSQAPGGGGNGSGSPIERPMDKVLEIETEVDKEIDELQIVRQEIKETLNQLDDENLKLLMEYRYIDGMTFEKIAVKMDISWRWSIKLHGKALGKIEISSL